MSRPHAGAGALVLLAALASRAGAQQRLPVLEAGVFGTAAGTVRAPVGIVGGFRGAARTGNSTRVALSLGTGVLGDRVSARGEAALEYLLAPRAAGRFGVYLGGGLAGVLGGGEGAYLLVYAGMERSPGLPAGWAVEAGLGGGFRVRLAYHWRRFPAGWRAEQ
ncbi:MAG TPA: hypothetical protein VF187_12305 [Gemmatimonadales bacterium]